MSNESIRTAIWNEMVDADRLARYYGALAGRKANVEWWMAILTTLFALISFALASQGVGGWVILSTGLTVLTSAVPLVFRLSGTVLTATYTQKALADITVEWKGLWRRQHELPAEAAEEEWRTLARRTNEITAPRSSDKVDERLRDTTEKEAYDYWRTAADSSHPVAPAT